MVFSHQERMIAVDRNLSWDGKTNEGTLLPEGIYFYQLTDGEKMYKGKLIRTVR
jgi:hypothetical protein